MAGLEPHEGTGDAGEVAEALAEAEIPSRGKEILKKTGQVILGIGVAGILLGFVLPWLTHTTWGQILHEMRHIGWGKAFYLFCLMFLGLWSYTFTLSASLPGMRHVPALIVNLCGSGISNSMPGGGAMGVAAQYAIFRSWGFSHRNIGSSLIVTSIWNLLLRALLPISAVLWLLASGSTNLPRQIWLGVLGAVFVAMVIAGLTIAILVSDSSAHSVGRLLNRILAPIMRLLKREQKQDVEALAVDIRSRVIGVIRPNWHRLTLGLIGFLGIYFILFRECMLAFGIDLPWAQAFACYALSRVLTMVPITPGGIGVTELAAGLIVAFGAGGHQAAAAVVLFAIYSHILEIPLGLLSAAAWHATRERFQVHQADGPDDVKEEHLPAFH